MILWNCWRWLQVPLGLCWNRRQREALPVDLVDRLETLPQEPMQALALARDLCESLDGQQQLWLIDWWQQKLWRCGAGHDPMHRLEVLRRHLLGFVQPRLAWEVALLDLSVS